MKELCPDRTFYNLIDTCAWGTRFADNYLVIGSLIEDFSTPNSVIWGAGAIMGGDYPLRHKPKLVKAVRGELSRNYLLTNGVECPQIYGDPALLIPMIYNKNVEPRYEIGMIPHVSELNNPVVAQLEKAGMKIIRFDDYDDWHTVIDQIRECRTIVSSSLHGLIISDAYSIPNVWIEISGNLLGGHFKFRDYFSGVGRTSVAPFQVTSQTSLTQLKELTKQWRKINFDPLPLLNSAPWSLNYNQKGIYGISAYTQHHNSGI